MYIIKIPPYNLAFSKSSGLEVPFIIQSPPKILF